MVATRVSVVNQGFVPVGVRVVEVVVWVLTVAMPVVQKLPEDSHVNYVRSCDSHIDYELYEKAQKLPEDSHVFCLQVQMYYKYLFYNHLFY